MNQKIIFTIIIFSLITVIPTAYAQLTLGSEAKQELIELKINPDGEINVKHIVGSSNMPVTVPLFLGEISNLIVSNDLGEEINSGTANDAQGNLSVLILPSNQNSIILGSSVYFSQEQLYLIDARFAKFICLLSLEMS